MQYKRIRLRKRKRRLAINGMSTTSNGAREKREGKGGEGKDVPIDQRGAFWPETHDAGFKRSPSQGAVVRPGGHARPKCPTKCLTKCPTEMSDPNIRPNVRPNIRPNVRLKCPTQMFDQMFDQMSDQIFDPMSDQMSDQMFDQTFNKILDQMFVRNFRPKLLPTHVLQNIGKNAAKMLPSAAAKHPTYGAAGDI